MQPKSCGSIRGHLNSEETSTLAFPRLSPPLSVSSGDLHIGPPQTVSPVRGRLILSHFSAAPPSAPHPSPSPGLTQAPFPPGHPGGVVFATPPPQMNTAPPSRQFSVGPRALNQQPYYQPRPGLPGSAPRQPASQPRPVAPTHVYQPGTQMMMISQQQLPFASSQSPAYFIQSGQYRPTYVATPQQYPVASGTTGFYGTSPAEYGAYYPAQQQYPPSVPAAPVILSPAQPQATPPPQPPVQTKRERKQVLLTCYT
ncbi:hypothetical protein SKAU_G00206640 [Synaphobranchus kaupii]|uniref:Eukaryotic translation initiation factor 4 gamma 1 n=1 Tax=Synaphobranchus kaupii TaxID=118154 RepID=A0A9Q1FGI1_SYNKA|nr:hypothetical protein SKAU_G00206640 [Synaphobranchus kaupii]